MDWKSIGCHSEIFPLGDKLNMGSLLSLVSGGHGQCIIIECSNFICILFSFVFMILVLCFPFKGHLYAVTCETSQASETSQISETGN